MFEDKFFSLYLNSYWQWVYKYSLTPEFDQLVTLFAHKPRIRNVLLVFLLACMLFTLFKGWGGLGGGGYGWFEQSNPYL